jgi:hypothetical protein
MWKQKFLPPWVFKFKFMFNKDFGHEVDLEIYWLFYNIWKFAPKKHWGPNPKIITKKLKYPYTISVTYLNHVYKSSNFYIKK